MKRLVSAPLVQKLLAWAIAAYGEVLIATLRWRLIDFEPARAAVAAETGLIGLFWHGQIAHAIACRGLLGAKPRRVMISHSRDGAFIAAAAERLGLPTIRGSTSRKGDGQAKGGAAAFRAAVRALSEGAAMLITPDGPRGPARLMPIGPVRLAKASGSPVFVLGLAARPALDLKSWDGARLPLPFARAVLVAAGPFEASEGLEDAKAEALRLKWQEALNGAQMRAEALIAPDAASPSPVSNSPGSNSSGRNLGLRLYRALTRLGEPILAPWLRSRLRAGKEDPARWREKLGFGAPPRPDGPLVWLHGASIGEGLALLPLAETIAAERPKAQLLITSATRASADLLRDKLPPGARHQFAPLDSPSVVGRFLDHWRPDLGVLAESEIWPNLILDAKARGARMALVSARLSKATVGGWRRAPNAARTLFSAFDLVLARDSAAARDLESLGAKVQGLADLKYGAAPLSVDCAALAALRAAFLGRTVLLAASTHPGEEAVILSAFLEASQAVGPGKDPRLVIVPRHPSRALEIEALARERGLTAGRRAGGADPGALSVYVADTLGELGLFYSLADLSILGGSLVQGVGGHNPLEPARLSRPFAAGPHIASWPVYGEMVQAGATQLMAPEGLAGLFGQTMDNPGVWANMALRAQAFVRDRDAAARNALAPILALVPR